MTRRPLEHDRRPATPLAVQVSDGDGGLASVALHRDAHGWSCRIDDCRFYVHRVRCGPTAPPTTWHEDD